MAKRVGDVKVLALQQPMHVVEDNREIAIIFQVEVLLGDLDNEFLHA
jgi:hypothetical protein